MAVLYIVAIEDDNELTDAKSQRFVNVSWVCDLYGCTLGGLRTGRIRRGKTADCYTKPLDHSDNALHATNHAVELMIR